MTAKNLCTVTTDLIESYGNTAKNVITAYRSGGERVAGLLEQRWDSALQKSRAKLSAETAKNASAAQKAFSGYYAQGLTVAADGATGVVNQMVKLAEAGVERAAANAALFEEKTGVTTLHAIAQATVPAALAVSKFAAQVEQQSATLARRIAGDKTATAHARRTSAFRKARTAKAI
jgi:murein L,D-transpeptidase YcbB/YkuD